MRELWWELLKHMTRAGLQSKREPAELPTRSQRYSWGLVEGDWACEAEQQPRGDTSGWSRSKRRQTHSRGRSGSKWHHSPSPISPSWHQSPSFSPPWPHPAEEWLHCSMENLHLWPRSQESRSMTQQCEASPCWRETEEASFIWGGWRAGQWAGFAHKHHPVLSREHNPQMK